MSQRLSTSVTFQSLTQRVNILEGRFARNDLQLTDTKLPLVDLTKVGVVNWRLGNWDDDTATNAFSIGFNSTATVMFDTSGNAKFSGLADAAYLRSTGTTAPTSGVGVELQWDGATGYVLSFDRDAGQFMPITLAASSISLQPIGGVLAIEGTATFGDSNCQLLIEAGNPTLRFDTGDGIVFHRDANRFLFYIGGDLVASIDGSGNMWLKGTLTQSVTP